MYAQVPVPAQVQNQPLLIVDATAHIGNGKVIPRAILAVENGIITQINSTEKVRIDIARYRIIDAKGQHLYPGLILPAVRAGLEDILSLRPSRDHAEVGLLNPNVRTQTAYNTDSEILPTLRKNGILIVQSTPQGGVISGSSSVFLLDGWNWEDATYKADDGIHLRWPSKEKDKEEQHTKIYQELTKLFKDARNYTRTDPLLLNLKLEAMRGLFTGDKKLYIHAKKAAEIIESIDFARNMGIEQPVLVGAHDAWHVADYLREHHISVLLADVHRLPLREDEPIDLPYRLPVELHKKGILVGLAYADTWSIASWRNLAFLAGQCVSYGLEKEQALQMITFNTAKILGIDKQTGTLEIGKDANFILSQGDLLDMKTHQVTHAFIQGREIDLSGKQELLYKRFLEKYKSEEALRPVPQSLKTLPSSSKEKRKKKR